MVNRITENIKYTMITTNLLTVSGKYGELMEKLSTQKNINRPSDDPVGMNDILDFRTARAGIAQFQTNITDAESWLKMTDTNLSGLYKVMENAKIIAITEAGAGGSPETRQTSAVAVSALIEEALTLLNAKSGENYIFGGSQTDRPPFSATYRPPTVTAASASTENTFNGTVVSGGTFTAAENKTYVLRVLQGGALDATTYQVSSDGGKTWGGSQTDLSAPVNLGDGVTLTLTAGTADLAAGDLFTVNGNIAGYYSGNEDSLNAMIGKDNRFVYNITGAELATAANGPVAQAAIDAGAVMADSTTVVLTRGGSAGSWALSGHENYPDMVISSQSASTVTIDADNDGTDDITINLSGDWHAGNTVTFDVTAGAPPTSGTVDVSGPGTVDLLGSLFALKEALETDDEAAISALIDDLKVAQTQVLQAQTRGGMKINSLQLTSGNHDAINLQITNMLADIENADLTKLITEFQMKQIAMQASYSMASQIGKMTIMDYL
ncbi:MAG: flagellar hook-associated protein FlgL [Smithellaceae bacterium]